jgi:hypothetical protein
MGAAFTYNILPGIASFVTCILCYQSTAHARVDMRGCECRAWGLPVTSSSICGHGNVDCCHLGFEKGIRFNGISIIISRVTALSKPGYGSCEVTTVCSSHSYPCRNPACMPPQCAARPAHQPKSARETFKEKVLVCV